MAMTATQRQRRHRKKIIREGKCIICRQKNDNLPRSRCNKCTTGPAKLNNQHRRQSKQTQGLCNLCGKNPSNPNRRRCEACCIKQRQWYKNSEYRDKNRVLDKQRRKERRKRIIDYYGGKCVCCGESESFFLSIDHINNDGANHRAHITKQRGRGKGAGSTTMDKWIEKNSYPDILQLLCHNCNMGKHLNNGICPHKSIGSQQK